MRNMARPLTLCDLDFTDLLSEDDKDDFAPRGKTGCVPPPPPLMGIGKHPQPPPTPMMSFGPPPIMRGMNGAKPSDAAAASIKKNKKTVKLFWKEVREDLIPATVGKTIWDELPKASIDTQKIEHLFESRAKDLMTKVTLGATTTDGESETQFFSRSSLSLSLSLLAAAQLTLVLSGYFASRSAPSDALHEPIFISVIQRKCVEKVIVFANEKLFWCVRTRISQLPRHDAPNRNELRTNRISIRFRKRRNENVATVRRARVDTKHSNAAIYSQHL